ncbi:thiamine pyrophosphate-dependent enzyme [Candidatus Nephthysia bennettiae]
MEPLSILDPEGRLHAAAPLGDEQALEALRLMLLSRALDERAIKLQRLGRLGTYGPVHGQEASVVGSAIALDPSRDWLVPAYREQPAMIRHGLPLERLLAGYMGRSNAARIPDGVRLLPRNQAVGAQLPHAAGLAWGLKLRKLEGVVLVYCGEGASSEGDFHESANLAGVVGAPLVYLLQNNGYAISTPSARQSAAPALALRAAGYGFPGILVDGNDLFAVHAATREAVERARRGEGPTLIESRTYRMGVHNTTDNPREYRDDAETLDHAGRDPIARVARYLEARGLWGEQAAARVRQEIAAEIDEAQRRAAEFPRPSAADVYEHAYGVPPPRVQQQRRETLEGR